jgi:hypothetical protein
MKKALIVGINDYAPVGAGGPDLNGCVNDARDMANTLVICGFSPAKIKILTNQNATRTNILNYLKSLISTSVKGFSGFLLFGTRNQSGQYRIGSGDRWSGRGYLSARLCKFRCNP